MAEKFGGKWTLGLGLLSTALFTFLTPFVIKIGGATWLFILRVLQGMGEVCFFLILYFSSEPVLVLKQTPELPRERLGLNP